VSTTISAGQESCAPNSKKPTARVFHKSAIEEYANQRPTGIVGELADFFPDKKWRLALVILVLLAFGLLVAFGGTGATPFIYTLI
jgi:hypothetical protein